jgi:hypothetical protein
MGVNRTESLVLYLKRRLASYSINNFIDIKLEPRKVALMGNIADHGSSLRVSVRWSAISNLDSVKCDTQRPIRDRPVGKMYAVCVRTKSHW